MHLSRRVFLASTASLGFAPWFTAEAAAQISAHPANDKDLPPVPPDVPIDGPRFLKCGPMIGHVSDEMALIWVKASNTAKLSANVGTTSSLADARVIESGDLTAENAFAATITVT